MASETAEADVARQILDMENRTRHLRLEQQRRKLAKLQAEARQIEQALSESVQEDNGHPMNLEGIVPRESVIPRGRVTGSSSSVHPESSVSAVHSTAKRQASEDSNTERPKRRRLVPLDKYKGKTLEEHRNFIRSCTTQFRRSPVDFKTEEDKVLYAMEYLEGAPRDAWYRVDDNRLDDDVYSWDTFVAFLRDLIIDPLNREMDVQQKYTDAKQQPNQGVRQFDNYLAGLEAQMEPQSETTRRDAFLTRLRDDIRLVIKN